MNELQLQVFICAADNGSFTKASEKLFLSPPSVMNYVNALEEELDVVLFQRSPRGITLTAAGYSVYDDARKLLDSCRHLKENARAASDRQPSTVRIGNAPLAPCSMITDFWERIKQQVPQFKLKIVPFQYTSENCLEVISRIGQEFDFIVTPCNSRRWLSLGSFYQLGESRIQIAVPYSHELAENDHISLKDLSNQTILMVKRGDMDILDSIRDKIRSECTNTKIFDISSFYDIDTFNRCEEENAVLLTVDGWAQVHPSLKNITVDWNYRMPYGLLYSRHPSDTADQFLNMIRKMRRFEE